MIILPRSKFADIHGMEEELKEDALHEVKDLDAGTRPRSIRSTRIQESRSLQHT